MKIKSIEVSNFKKYDSQKFEPDPSKVVYATVGSNGVGKTTLQEAILYALTGDSPDNAIKIGKDELLVSCELDDGTQFERGKSTTKPNWQKLNGKNLTATRLKEHLETVTGVPLDGWRLSLSADLIDNMKPEQFAEFIRKYTPEDLDVDTVVDYMGTVDPEIIDMLKDYLPATGKFGTNVIDDAYNAIVEQRKSFKREVEQRKSRIAGCLVERPSETKEDVQAQLEKVIKEEGAMEGVKAAIKTYEKAVEGQKKQEALIENLKSKIDLSTAVRPDPNKLKTIRDSKEDINKQLITAQSMINTMKDTVKTFEDTITRLNSTFCPLSESIECKNTKERSSLKAEFEEQITAQKEGIKLQEKIVSEAMAKKADLDKQERDYLANERSYQELLIMKKQLEDAKAAMPTLPKKPVLVDPETRDFAEEKSKLQSLLNKIQECDKRDKLEKELETIQKQWKTADTLVKLLAPKGKVMTDITKYYLDVFEAICNEKSEKLRPGFTLKFVPEDGVKIYCETTPGVGYIPYESASSGERAYVLFILMDLIANGLTASNVMVLDDLDKLDKESFDALIELIMSPEIQDQYSHIFISAVNHEDTVETLKKYPDIDLHML